MLNLKKDAARGIRNESKKLEKMRFKKEVR